MIWPTNKPGLNHKENSVHNGAEFFFTITQNILHGNNTECPIQVGKAKCSSGKRQTSRVNAEMTTDGTGEINISQKIYQLNV